MSRPESQKYISSLLDKMVEMREEIDQLKQEKTLKSKASTARAPKSREGLEKHLNKKQFSQILGIAQSPLTLGQQIIQYLAKQTLKDEDKQPGVAKYLRSKIKEVAEIREANQLMSLL